MPAIGRWEEVAEEDEVEGTCNRPIDFFSQRAFRKYDVTLFDTEIMHRRARCSPRLVVGLGQGAALAWWFCVGLGVRFDQGPGQ